MMDVTENLESEYFRSLYNESDRGCLLLVASRLDDSLKTLHGAHIGRVVAQSAGLLKKLFAQYAPLSSFAGRSQIAYAYGLIPHEQYVDLETIRGIRNKAAHSISEFSLTSSGIREKVFSLTAARQIVEQIPELAEGFAPEELLTIRSPGAGETPPKMHLMLACLCMDLWIVRRAAALLEEEIVRLKVQLQGR